MNVLHFASYSIGSKVYENLFCGLSLAGVSFQSVFVPVGKNQEYVAPIIDNVEYAVKPIKGVLARASFQYKSTLYFKQSMLDCERTYDLIHAHTLYSDGWAAYLRSIRDNIPLVVSIRNSDINYFYRFLPYTRSYSRQVLEHASAIIFLSEGAKRNFLAHFNEDKRAWLERKAVILPNGLPDVWFDNDLSEQISGFKQGDNQVLFVGNGSRNKNLHTLIQACELLWKRIFFRLIVIGVDGKSTDKISYMGRINDMASLKSFYRAASVMVVASRTETFGLVYVEAYSQGTPVIATRGQGFDGWVDEGVTGFLVSPDNVAQLAEKIERALDLKQLNLGTILECAGKFKLSSVASQTAKLYKTLI